MIRNCLDKFNIVCNVFFRLLINIYYKQYKIFCVFIFKDIQNFNKQGQYNYDYFCDNKEIGYIFQSDDWLVVICCDCIYEGFDMVCIKF